MSINVPTIQGFSGLVRYDESSSSFVVATSNACTACFQNMRQTSCIHGSTSPNEAESTVRSPSAQPSLANRVTVDTSSGIMLRVRLPRNHGIVDRPHEGEPSQKRRRIEKESSPELSGSFISELDDGFALPPSAIKRELSPELPDSFASESEDDLVLAPASEESQQMFIEDEDSVYCDTDEETSSDTDYNEALAISDSNPLPIEESRERSLPMDAENSLTLATSSPLVVSASVEALKTAVNTDFDQFKHLVRVALESEAKLSDSEWQDVFIDVIRKRRLDAVIFLLEQSCINPRIQIVGAREAFMLDSWIAFAIMSIGTMSQGSEVDLFLKEAGFRGKSNLIRLALIKGWVTDALANNLISHWGRLKTDVTVRLAAFNIKKPLRGDLVVRTIEADNTALAIALLKNNALIRPLHRGKAARLALEKKNYEVLEALLSTNQLLTNREIAKILLIFQSNNDPRAIGLFRNYFQGFMQYRHFAASML